MNHVIKTHMFFSFLIQLPLCFVCFCGVCLFAGVFSCCSAFDLSRPPYIFTKGGFKETESWIGLLQVNVGCIYGSVNLDPCAPWNALFVFFAHTFSNPNTRALLFLHYTLQVVLKMSQLRLNLSTVTKVTEAEKGTFFLVIFCCCYFVFFHAHLNIVIILNIYCLLPAGISSQRPCKGQGSREQMQRPV